MKSNKKYTISLIVRVIKSGEIYNNTARVVFDVQSSKKPMVGKNRRANNSSLKTSFCISK